MAGSGLVLLGGKSSVSQAQDVHLSVLEQGLVLA